VARDLLGRLAGVVGDGHVITDPAVLASVAVDWTGRYRGEPRAAVAPADAAQVAAVLLACGEAGVAVVPQGGNTGLAAGAVPPAGSVVLLTRRLTRLDVDPVAGAATVGAGVTVAELDRAAAAHGLAYGVDLASRDTATLGGTIATNAGGLRVVGYGPTRAQVQGLEVVLADGRVLSRLGGVRKEAVGPDLAGLFVGSEGILGVVTAARLRLVPRPAERCVAVLGVDGVPAALRLLPSLRALPGLLSLEYVGAAAAELVRRHAALVQPVGPELVLVEVAGPPEVLEPLDGLPGAELAVGLEPGERARLWSLRDRVTDSIAAEASVGGRPVHKLDVALPLEALAAFVAELPDVLAGRGRPVLFGHLAEANLHVNLLDLPEDDTATDDAVLELVGRHGGAISSEHGVGRQKAHALGLSRSPEEIAVLRGLKWLLDPAGLLNPGALLPPE
jgi:FAD/FMN-containing dehydrogenase